MFTAIKSMFKPNILRQFKQAEKKFISFTQRCSVEDMLTLSPKYRKEARVILYKENDTSISKKIFGGLLKLPLIKPVLIITKKFKDMKSLIIIRHETVHAFQKIISFAERIFYRLFYPCDLFPYFKKIASAVESALIKGVNNKITEEKIQQAKNETLLFLRKQTNHQLKYLKKLNLTELQAYDLSVKYSGAKLDSFYKESELNRGIYSVMNDLIRRVERERKLVQ